MLLIVLGIFGFILYGNAFDFLGSFGFSMRFFFSSIKLRNSFKHYLYRLHVSIVRKQELYVPVLLVSFCIYLNGFNTMLFTFCVLCFIDANNIFVSFVCTL
ncbi:hypothetical protein Hanom_Chr04g00345481 [Helianthus anomalus]